MFNVSIHVESNPTQSQQMYVFPNESFLYVRRKIVRKKAFATFFCTFVKFYRFRMEEKVVSVFSGEVKKINSFIEWKLMFCINIDFSKSIRFRRRLAGLSVSGQFAYMISR